MRDPLSVSATILPQTSYDPLERSNKLLADFLKTQKESYTSQQEIFEKLKVPEAWEDQKFANLLNQRQDLFDYGTNSIMQGYDLKDISNPKNRDKIREFQMKKALYEGNVNKYAGQKELMTKAIQLLGSDEGKDIDREKTQANILALRDAKTVEEGDKFLQSIGYNIVVPKFKPIDIGTYIANNIDKLIEPEKGTKETVDKEAGLSITQKWERVSPQKVKAGFKALYIGNDQLKETIEFQRKKDPLDNQVFNDEENLDWLYRNYGNTKVKQDYSETSVPLPGYSKGTYEDLTVYPQGISTEINTGTEAGRYKSTGTNAIGFTPKKIPVNLTSNGFYKSSGKPTLDLPEAVEFTPINSAEYYVLTKNVGNFKKGIIITETDVKRGTRFKKGDYVKKRMVEGIFKTFGEVPVKEYTFGGKKYTEEEKKSGTILIPYEDIKVELEKNYKGLNEAIKQSTQSKGLEYYQQLY